MDGTVQKERSDLLCMDRAALVALVTEECKEKPYRAAQIAAWLCKAALFDEMTDLPKPLIARLKECATLSYPAVFDKKVSALDKTVKFLYRLTDGQLVEAVVMRYEHGYSICISTQAGCRMGCRFCASTLGGRVRNLTEGEMLGEILVAQRSLGVRISHVVLMGIGEPLDNYDHVLRFLRLVSAKEGLNISGRNISLSTCGLVPRIADLAKENLPLTLSVSLHASDNKRRSAIMPVNDRYPLEELLPACRDYFDATGRRISFEYTLIAGENDAPADADALAALLKTSFGDRPFHVNLIPVNPVKESGFQQGSRASVLAFCRRLNRLHVNATVRRTLGADINASCGQLRHAAGQNAKGNQNS